MSTNIIVKEIQNAVSNKTGKPYATIIDTTGDRIGVFDDRLIGTAKSLRPGQHISISYEMNGKYKNALQIVPSDKYEPVSTPAQNAPNGIPSPFNDKKEKRIARESAIKSSIEFFNMLQVYGVKEIPNTEKVLDVAGTFEEWINREDDAK